MTANPHAWADEVAKKVPPLPTKKPPVPTTGGKSPLDPLSMLSSLPSFSGGDAMSSGRLDDFSTRIFNVSAPFSVGRASASASASPTATGNPSASWQGMIVPALALVAVVMVARR